MDLDTIERRIRICTILLEKKTEQYHASVLRGEETNKLSKQCYILDSTIQRLKRMRKKLGGKTDGETN